MGEQVAEIIKTRHLELVDAQGNTRAALGFRDGSPRLVLLDESNRTRAMLALRPNGNPMVELHDEQEVVLIQAGLGDTGIPLVTVTDQDRGNRVVLGIGDDGRAGLALTRDGAVVVKLP